METGNAEVALFASVNGSEKKTRTDGNEEEAGYNDKLQKIEFVAGDKIRLCNTVSFSEPDFQNAPSFVFGEETQEGRNMTYYKFIPEGTGTGDVADTKIDWNDFTPTSFAFFFEAAYYPGGSPFEEVPEDQTEQANFKNADLLLAHHRMELKDRYDDIYLTFHHVFAMVQVEVTLPLGTPPFSLPEQALKSVTLQNVQTGYKILYNQTIPNDDLRVVEGAGDNDKTVKMYRQNYTETDGKQKYVFLAIIPVPQELAHDFIHFEIQMNEDSEDVKTFTFHSQEGGIAISLRQSYITRIQLEMKQGSNEIIPLKAEILPWKQSTAHMELEPEDATKGGAE